MPTGKESLPPLLGGLRPNHPIRPGDCAFAVDHIVPGQRHGPHCGGELHLEHPGVVAPERLLAADQIQLPHAHKPVVVQRPDALPIGFETAAPVLQGFGIVQAQYLDVGDPQAGTLDLGQHLRQGRGIATRKNVFA